MPSTWELPDERAWLVLDQLRQEIEAKKKPADRGRERWQSEAARALELDPSTVNKLFARTRGAGKSVLAAMVRKLALDPNFFHQRSLGPAPRFRDHAGKERLERFDALSPYPDFEAALEAEGLIALAAAGDPDAIVVVKRVRGVSFAGGAAEADYAEALHQIGRAKAALRGKAMASKAEPEKVEVRPGRVKIGPARRR